MSGIAELRDELTKAPGVYGLPSGYQRNPPTRYEPSTQKSAYWQVPTYQLASAFCVDAKVLDLGCGLGVKLIEFIKPKAKWITGVDMLLPNPKAVSEFVRADLDSCAMSIAGSPFDVIIASDVLEHLHRPDYLLQTIRLCSAEHTKIVLSTPARQLIGGKDDGPPANSFHVQEWSSDELRDWLKSEGFKILQYPLLPPGRDWSASPSCQAAVMEISDG